MQKQIRRRTVPATCHYPDSNLHPLLARVYRGRGIKSPVQLDHGLGRLLPPAQLLNADRAAGLLADALVADAKIVIVGDFDADGATSTALVGAALCDLGANQMSYIVPKRFEFG